jgi:hypothetical protein
MTETFPQVFSTDSIDNLSTIFSILYEKYPNNKYNLTYNYNTKHYTLELTDEITKNPKNSLDVPIDFNIEVIYGDSVSHDTPILLRNAFTKMVMIVQVSNICTDFKKSIFDKEEAETDIYEVWSKTGWNPIQKVIRHKTNKRMYKVSSEFGMVIVSEDHSLLTIEGIEVKPNELTSDTQLLHSFPDITPIESNIDINDIHVFGFLYSSEIYKNVKNESITRYSVLSDKMLINLKRYFGRDIKIVLVQESTDNYCIHVRNTQEYIKKFKYIFTDGLSVILNESIDVIKEFMEGYYTYTPVNIELWLSSIPCRDRAILYFLNKRTDLLLTRNTPRTKIELIEHGLEPGSEYIYDIQTRDGTFSAGIGELIVKNTDSIFLKLQFNTNDKELCRRKTFDLATKCGDKLTKEVFNRKPIEMEFEKVFQPFILLTKKRYIGNKYEDVKNPMKLKGLTTTGIALARRDYSQYTKECYQEIIDTLVNKSNINEGIKVYKEYVNNLVMYNVNVDQLVLTALLNKDYKTRPVHVVLAEKMKKRQMEIQIGDRVPYVFIESDDKKLKKSELGEDPMYFKNNPHLKINRVCYLENLSKPIIGFFKVVLEKSPDVLESVIDYTNKSIIACHGKAIKF